MQCLQHVKLMTDLDGSNLSVSNTHTSYQDSNRALAPSIGRPTSDTFITSNAQTKLLSHLTREVTTGQENVADGSENLDKISVMTGVVRHYLKNGICI